MATLQELGIDHLSMPERLELAEQLWASVAEKMERKRQPIAREDEIVAESSSSNDDQSATETIYQSTGVSISTPDHVRERPGMYVGSTEMFGFIQYLVCSITLVLAYHPKRITVTVGDEITIETDAMVSIQEVDGKVVPYEEVRNTRDGHSIEGLIVNALSQSFSTTVVTSTTAMRLRCQQGQRISFESCDSDGAVPGTTLQFAPDRTILKQTNVSAAVFQSYFRRLSFLHPTVRFSFSTNGITSEFHEPNGIASLFTSIASPLQIMHDPIHIRAEEHGLKLEIVMAYHSWKEDTLTCFINNGRAVSSGTHERGYYDSIAQLKSVFGLPQSINNGVVAVASMYYPDVTWQGCIKATVRNPELRPLVSRLIIQGAQKWAKTHPEAVEQIRQVTLFRFPEFW